MIKYVCTRAWEEQQGATHSDRPLRTVSQGGTTKLGFEARAGLCQAKKTRRDIIQDRWGRVLCVGGTPQRLAAEAVFPGDAIGMLRKMDPIKKCLS